MPSDLGLLKTSSLLAYPLVFLGGSVELSRRRSFTLSLTFAVGLAVTFMVLGVVASPVGELRFSPGHFTTVEDVEYAVQSLQEIV